MKIKPEHVLKLSCPDSIARILCGCDLGLKGCEVGFVLIYRFAHDANACMLWANKFRMSPESRQYPLDSFQDELCGNSVSKFWCA